MKKAILTVLVLMLLSCGKQDCECGLIPDLSIQVDPDYPGLYVIPEGTEIEDYLVPFPDCDRDGEIVLILDDETFLMAELDCQ